MELINSIKCFENTNQLNYTMQKTKALLLLVLVMFLTSVAFSQTTEKRLWMATKIIVKSEQIGNFENSLKEIIRLFKENDYPYEFSFFRSTGFDYYYFMKMNSLEDWDKIISASNAIWEKLDRAIYDDYVKCIASYKRFTVSDMPEYNYSPENPRLNMEDINYAIWDVHYIKPGMEEKYFESVKKWVEIAREHSFGDPVVMLEGGIGSQMPVYFGVLYGKDDIDMKQENRKLWEAWGEEGKKMYQGFITTLRDRDMIEFWFRRDLSLSNE
jgi:hypothetical protein